ncbi:MAG: hypothetical protein WC867_04140 [Candidatus Pacearchaeota archaeon]|jgi:hypothetical protein
MKKRGEKAQVAIFVIVALVIIVIIGIFMFIKGSSNSDICESFGCKVGLKSDMDVIKGAISDCSNTETRKALKRIGLQGGFYNKPESFYQLDWAFIPYYYDKGNFLMPEKTKIESELSSYVDSKFEECVKDLSFNNYELEITKPKTSSKITKSKVTFSINVPINIKKGSEVTTFNLNQETITYNSTLNEMIELAKYITESHKENPELICINCIVELAKENKLYVDFIQFPYEERTTLVMLSENKTYSEPYVFEFLNRYGESSGSITTN